MAPLHRNKIELPKVFIIIALFLLAAGMLFGLTGGLQYVIPGFLKEHLSFEKVRPLHVSSVVFWIIISAMGSVLTYIQEHSGKKIRFPFLLKMQLVVFIISIVAILTSYCLGIFGGREYWEFPPILSLPIIFGWVLFIFNFFGTIGSLKKQPVYVWMWLTGIIFFLFTFLESYLWVFPYFRNNVINDMTIQWKSYGSLVGSWNLLINGCALFLMDKISGSKKYSHSKIAFALYFTGLFNLMFNWGHHIYTLPTHNYIKYISYFVSMTELAILGRIIYLWRSSLTTAKKYFYQASYRFLVAADVWIFLTLGLAILMSIPAINLYTHGTHITVAHTMGATIGINSMLLLAVAYDILGNTCQSFEPYKKMMNRGYWLANFSLFIFWIALIIAGIIKSKWQMSTPQIPFSSMMMQIRPFLIAFVVSGAFLMTGLLMVIYPLLKNQFVCYFKPAEKIKFPKQKKLEPTLFL
jgi:nitric oxide reductase subunit B